MRASGWPGATGSSWWASHSVSTPASCAVDLDRALRVATWPMTCPEATASPSARSAAGAKVPAVRGDDDPELAGAVRDWAPAVPGDQVAGGGQVVRGVER